LAVVTDSPSENKKFAAPPTSRTSRKASAFIGGGVALALSVMAGLWVGHVVDQRWGTDPWGLVAGGWVGFAVGMYSFLAPLLRP
jgi:F0F1-type ATP synthase assembly protein I